LLSLDHLRQGINLRAFGQRDPLNEYKTEAFALFERMLFNLRETITQTLSLVEVTLDPRVLQAMQKPEDIEMHETRHDPALEGTDKAKAAGDMAKVQSMTQRTVFNQQDPSTWVNTPRNSPCPCGSDKKYKHCHGKV
jgi:preprotein translocase subunit SecA